MLVKNYKYTFNNNVMIVWSGLFISVEFGHLLDKVLL